jgi:hypothetical protein
MDRREAVKYISILLGGTIVGADAILSGCTNNTTASKAAFSADDIAYLNEIGETILPQTSTPGAKAANVGQFMTTMVNDCYEEADQKAFRDGMDKLNDESKKKFNGDFMSITPQQRHDLLVALDKESKDYQKKVDEFNNKERQKVKDEGTKGKAYTANHMAPHYFMMMKQLTLLGFFTSEVGMTKTLNYKAVPGRFDGCVPYTKGMKVVV